jgi:SAM-dependent methyltransferase
MKQATRQRLNALNQHFYERHAPDFSQTRGRPWRGMASVLEKLSPTARAPRVLDIGCGNGRLVLALRERFGERFEYLGVDSSAALLGIARELYGDRSLRFERCDFVSEDPERALPGGEHELVALFGVLHHVPGEDARRALLKAAARRVARGGLLALTLFRLDQSPRLARRRLPPERHDELAPEHAVRPEELEPGDELLRWGATGSAVRYCHFTDEAELGRLLAGLDLELADRFRADGEGDRLNEYLLLCRPEPDRKLGPEQGLA